MILTYSLFCGDKHRIERVTMVDISHKGVLYVYYKKRGKTQMKTLKRGRDFDDITLLSRVGR